jgi:hypothetical protein
MSRIDQMIDADLAALGENSKHNVPALDEALQRNDAYRDDRPGAEARRNALADERKRELVLMPLTLSHVFAHRIGRIAAGGMALLVSLKMLAILADPVLMRFAAWLVPGLSVTMLILMSALAIVCAYVVATWFAEAWFARRMRNAIKTGDDPHTDIDHLARGPLEIAHAAVQKVDGWSLGIFLAGVTTVTLVFGYVLVMVGMQHTISNAWQLSTQTLDISRHNLGLLAFFGLACVTVAFLVGRACDGHGGQRLVRILSGWPVLAISAVIAIATAYQGLHVMLTWRHRWPDQETRVLLAMGSAVTVFVPAAWALLFWRRREQARIHA